MRYTAHFLLAMICLQAVCAVSLRKNQDAFKTSFVLERLRFVGKKSTIAHDIVSAVELNLSSGGKIDEVIALVNEALDDIINRRSELNAEWIQKESDLNGIISQADSDLQSERARLGVVSGDITRLGGEISDLHTKIDNLEREISDLNDREDQVDAARTSDINTYATRKQRDLNSLDVLTQIINKLNALQQRGNSFLEVSKKEIERALSRIPRSNPIQALVQLSTKFNPEKLGQVIDKLQKIQNAIQSSFDDDRNGEEQSENHYKALIAEINHIRDDKNATLIQAYNDLDAAEASLKVNEDERDALNTQITLNQSLFDTTSAELASETTSYTLRISEADTAIVAIRSALQILSENQSNLQNRAEGSDVESSG